MTPHQIDSLTITLILSVLDMWDTSSVEAGDVVELVGTFRETIYSHVNGI